MILYKSRLLPYVYFIRLGSLPERPYPILPLIGEGMGKILGKNFLPAILLIPSPHQERGREISFCEDRKLPSRISINYHSKKASLFRVNP
jgi:hypothetical protein